MGKIESIKQTQIAYLKERSESEQIYEILRG